MDSRLFLIGPHRLSEYGQLRVRLATQMSCRIQQISRRRMKRRRHWAGEAS